MKIISYKDAQSRGLASYFTGELCVRGHLALRRTVSRACRACDAENQKARYDAKLSKDTGYIAASRKRAKRWAEQNAERYKENQKRWHEANRKQVAEYNKEYRAANAVRIKARLRQKKADHPDYFREEKRRQYAKPGVAERIRRRSKQWRQDNPKRYAEQLKRWKLANPERAKEIARAGSINRRAKMRALGKLSADDIRMVRSAGKCATCGNVHQKMEIDHIIPISRGGDNHVLNLQLLCQPCNRSKWAKDMAEWLVERFPQATE